MEFSALSKQPSTGMSSTRSTDREIKPLSVVIPTLGGDVLEGTIAHLNRGAVIPAEILVCIPDEEAHRVAHLELGNVSVIRTPCRGQVAQRAFGFSVARQPLVLQLDDDILLRPADLDKLIQSLYRLGRGNAVAPIYRDLTTGRCLHAYRRGAVGRIQNLYAFIVGGAPWGTARMGVISYAGVGYGVDENYCGAAPLETQWQPGGCVLSYREELMTDDFYPFSGKAYCEDLIHSLMRRKRGVRLWVVPGAYCMTIASPAPFSWKGLRAEMRARRHVVQLGGGNARRLVLWLAIDLVKRAASVAVSRLVDRSR